MTTAAECVVCHTIHVHQDHMDWCEHCDGMRCALPPRPMVMHDVSRELQRIVDERGGLTEQEVIEFLAHCGNLTMRQKP